MLSIFAFLHLKVINVAMCCMVIDTLTGSWNRGDFMIQCQDEEYMSTLKIIGSRYCDLYPLWISNYLKCWLGADTKIILATEGKIY